MNELKYRWSSPNKDIPIGTLIKFVHAPPRFKGEDWRSCGFHLEGKAGVILAGPYPDSHQWGGIFTVHARGETFSHWGDFMEVVK